MRRIHCAGAKPRYGRSEAAALVRLPIDLRFFVSFEGIIPKPLMIKFGGGGLTLDGDAHPYEEVPPQLDTNAIARIYPPSGVSETPAGLLGHSGASIEILGDRVVKSGSDPRIYEQARFCSQHQGVCPTVYKIITGYRRYAYEMERLDELPNLTNPDLTGHIIDIAYREFWRHK